MSTELPIVGVTMGDPAGIGSEIIVKAYPQVTTAACLVVLGNADVMDDAVETCESTLEVRSIETVEDAIFEEGVLDVVDFDNVADLERGGNPRRVWAGEPRVRRARDRSRHGGRYRRDV
jgi:4-hydroxythreonine-4-phosphate dehydrogenase